MSGLENSAVAYAKFNASGKALTRRNQVLWALTQFGRQTTGEVFERLSGDGIHFPANANIIARCIELEEMGMIQQSGTKFCDSTSQNVTAWEIIEGATPKKLTKKLSYKQQCIALTARVAELEAENASLRNRLVAKE